MFLLSTIQDIKSNKLLSKALLALEFYFHFSDAALQNSSNFKVMQQFMMRTGKDIVSPEDAIIDTLDQKTRFGSIISETAKERKIYKAMQQTSSKSQMILQLYFYEQNYPDVNFLYPDKQYQLRNGTKLIQIVTNNTIPQLKSLHKSNPKELEEVKSKIDKMVFKAIKEFSKYYNESNLKLVINN